MTEIQNSRIAGVLMAGAVFLAVLMVIL